MCFLVRQLTCNVIIERVGFKSTILLAPFVCPIFAGSPFPVSLPSLELTEELFKCLYSDTLTLHPDDQTLCTFKRIIFFQMCELFVLKVISAIIERCVLSS